MKCRQKKKQQFKELMEKKESLEKDNLEMNEKVRIPLSKNTSMSTSRNNSRKQRKKMRILRRDWISWRNNRRSSLES